MIQATLLTTLFLALSISATPALHHVRSSSTSLTLSRRLNTTSVHNLVAHDQARARSLMKRGLSSDVEFLELGSSPPTATSHNEPITNQAVQYIATVTVGTGAYAAQYSLTIDTGSSNTWIGANPNNPYIKTSSSSVTSNKVSVSYGSGSFSGMEYIDTVTLSGSGLVIEKQSIGVASMSNGFSNSDGILGIGPVDLTEGTLSPATDTLIPTLTDNLYSQHIINSNSIAISFEPTAVENIVNGEITWGGTDKSKYTGSITYIPLTTTSPANSFWGVDQSIRYGTQIMLSTTAGIVDTGTSLILLATDAFKKYTTATGGVMDKTTGLLKISSTQLSELSSLFFDVEGRTFELTANAQIWPRSLNTLIGGSRSAIYLVVADLGESSGGGLDFILGYAFLERFYSVYDTAGKRVGLATTSYTTATTN